MYLRNRVQWFWHLICFMCFWFGFLNIEGFLSFLTFHPPKKVVPPLRRVEKISSKLGVQGIKRMAILRWFHKCLKFGKREKVFTEKTKFYRTWKILQKIVFLRKKSLWTSWCKISTHFWNQHKIPLLLIPFAANLKEIFFWNCEKGRQCFFGS